MNIVVSPGRSAQVVITRPASSGPNYELPITNIQSLVIPASQHKLGNVNNVTVTDVLGNVILTDVRIEPMTNTVHFHSTRPLSGFIYIS